jgi:hypothetical protein
MAALADAEKGDAAEKEASVSSEVPSLNTEE